MDNADRNRNRKPKADSGTHLQGYYLVMPREGLRVGQRTERWGTECVTLSQARKLAKPGDCIVRWDDRVVVSVKH